MNRFKNSLLPIKSIERVNNKSKKNVVDNKNHSKSPYNDIIISHSFLKDKHDESVLSSVYELLSNAIEKSISSKIITINNNIDTHSHFELDKFKVNKEVNKSNKNTIDEMGFNNNMIEDKVKGGLNDCIDVHSDTNVCN